MLPALFIGHGSPMNALGGNRYSGYLQALGRDLPRPRGILAISAHWETKGTEIVDVDFPPTIHDFFGFPPELYKIKYPAPGAPEVVQSTEKLLGLTLRRSKAWGFDHGTWAVLAHLYGAADIPVTQLSLNTELTLRDHFALAQKLRPLREQGILILGSGNIVHNLRNFNWREDSEVMPWAQDFDHKIERALLNRDFEMLLDFKGIDPALVKMAVPTPEHYLPLVYVLGTAGPVEPLSSPFAEIQNGSISMRSVRVG